MGGFATDDLVKVNGPVRCVICQHLSVCDLAVEGWRHPVSIRPRLGQRTLDMVEMLHRPRNRWVHGAEIPYQALQVLPTHAPLGYRDVQEVPEFLELALWEGDRPRLGVGELPEDLIDALPISLPSQELLDQY